MSNKSEVDINRLKNARQELTYMENEYIKWLKRHEEVSDCQYVNDLKERIIVIDDRVKRMKKGKKLLEVERLHRENRMNKIIEIGKSDILVDMNKIKNDITVYQTKNTNLDQALERKENLIQRLRTKIEKLNITFNCLKTEISTYKKSIQTPSNLRYYSTLKQRTLVLTKEINLIQTRNNIAYKDLANERLRLEKQIAEIENKIDQKNK